MVMFDFLLSISSICLLIVCLYLLREVNDLRKKYEYIDRQVWIIEDGYDEEV